MTAMSPAPAPSARRSRFARLAARFRRAEGGATAVEFAMVALPFFTLLFGILELALIFILSTTLDNASQMAARTIRTGQLQMTSGSSDQTFRTAICNNLGWMASDCGTSLNVDVETYPKFADITDEVLQSPVQAGVFKKAEMDFKPGGPGDIVLVRVYYQWSLITPLLSKAVNRLEGGKILVTSTLSFRNEPYS